mmetsp:Transcript_89995/g.178892  ORF Transcript_89995/g.178892 Transcript_89995/m.178892 type:complete len:588 (+) Transcript_89995:74-1837(+)
MTGGQRSAQGVDGQPMIDRLLSELQEYHHSTCRRRAEFRTERSELNARLVRLGHELRSEELMGRDLERRIETLEAALQRERAEHEHLLLQNAASDDVAIGTSGPLTADTLVVDCSKRIAAQVQEDADLLAAYVERLPAIRERSCRELLRSRLREAGIELATPTIAKDGRGNETLKDNISGESGTALEVAQLDVSGSGPLEAAVLNESPELPMPLWGNKQWTLRSHLDGARCLVIDDQLNAMVSCGEDALVKVWDTSPLWRNAPQADELEPYATLRGHTAPVFALAYRQQDRRIFSAGRDCNIRVWHLPEAQTHDPYGMHLTVQQRSLRAGLLLGHSDSVWSLQAHPHLAYLASASADGCVGLWSVEVEGLRQQDAGAMEASFTLRPPTSSSSDAQVSLPLDLPACVAWVPSDAARLLTGYVSSRIAVFDVKRGTQVLELLPATSHASRSPSNADAAYQHLLCTTSASCHQVLQFAVTGHADGSARVLDLNSGRFVATLSGHSAAVTSVCLDPAQGYGLVTAGHDGFLRHFDLRTGLCCQELHLHRPKYSEAIHSVCHSKRMLATSGADGNICVLPASEQGLMRNVEQ